jgi:Holliday junction DNA helicase RuvA
MIAKLSGRIDSTGDDWAIVDVGGVGYLVGASSRTLAQLRAGEAAALMVETHVRDDRIQLFGFLTRSERDWFRLLMTVQGVGAKVALALLSAVPADRIGTAIAAGDKAALTQAAGVGAKLAQRITSELRDKVAALQVASAAHAVIGSKSGAAEPAPISDAVSALVNLGYSPTDAYTAVSRAQKALGGEPAGTEALIRAALGALGPRDLAGERQP